MDDARDGGETGEGSGPVRAGERMAAGEDHGVEARFTAARVAEAFEVDVRRVEHALAGEFDLGADADVDSRQAQHLSEVILGDAPMDIREAALMRLGAFTPRPDDAWGVGDTAPGEQSFRLAASATIPDDVLASKTSSHDPSQPNE